MNNIADEADNKNITSVDVQKIVNSSIIGNVYELPITETEWKQAVIGGNRLGEYLLYGTGAHILSAVTGL